ncbi:MAG TPA: DNA primase, partial [Cyclobacteriaceae bacterium]|nr:DNA primase [Cyclobacteriaceae bacterium]
KKVVTELITTRYEISPHWKDKHIYVPAESDLLQDVAFTNVLRLKFRVVQKMMEENLSRIRMSEEAKKADEVEKYLEQQDGLKKAEQELASILGIVVAR